MAQDGSHDVHNASGLQGLTMQSQPTPWALLSWVFQKLPHHWGWTPCPLRGLHCLPPSWALAAWRLGEAQGLQESRVTWPRVSFWGSGRAGGDTEGAPCWAGPCGPQLKALLWASSLRTCEGLVSPVRPSENASIAVTFLDPGRPWPGRTRPVGLVKYSVGATLPSPSEHSRPGNSSAQLVTRALGSSSISWAARPMPMWGQ